MKTKYRFIHFNNLSRRNLWGCYNNRTEDRLGTIDWFDDWNQYEFSGTQGACFTADCLRDIAEFIEQLKAQG